MVYDMKYCENCGRAHEGPLWETFIDGDNKPLELLLCSTPRYKEEDEKEKAEDKTYENEETPAETDTDRHKGYESENYDYEEEVKYDGFEFKFQKGSKVIKTFIIIVVLAGYNPITGGKDLMIFPQKFETSEACLAYAKENKEPLFFKTWEFYGVKKIENIYCVEEEKFKEMDVRPNKKEDISPTPNTPLPDGAPSTPLPDLPNKKKTLDWSDWNQSI